jgi:excisionase family DNA binding protein
VNEATITAITTLLAADPPTDKDRIRLAALLGTGSTAAPLPRILRFREAAQLLGCSKRTLQNFVKRGQLVEFKPAGARRAHGFKDSDVRRFLGETGEG